jgi:hypothetical protein
MASMRAADSPVDVRNPDFVTQQLIFHNRK